MIDCTLPESDIHTIFLPLIFLAVHSSRAVLPSVARVSVMLRDPPSAPAPVATGDVTLLLTSPIAENGIAVWAIISDAAAPS